MTSSHPTLDYAGFLARKTQLDCGSGFEPIEIPGFLFDFQGSLTDWAIRRGGGLIAADCGLGKSPMAFVWADNVIRYTNGRVLILTPLGVTGQMLREAMKFGFDAEISRTGKFSKRMVITNYEKLHLFSPNDFAGVVGDESSGIKNFDANRTAEVIEFMRTIRFRLLCTATAAPNDYIELGTSAEALGEMGFSDMITKFFKQQTSKDHLGWGRTKYLLRAHGEHDFWRWVCSWARACRKPSDLGFDDDRFILPPLESHEHVIEARTRRRGFLFDLPAISLQDQREERRRTLHERCEKVASLVADTGKPALAWCHLNPEGDHLERIIPGAIQVSGKDCDEAKEEKLLAFISGQIRVLVSKPVVFGFGLNLQHCAHETFFPSHSFEQYYQAVRRCWRFGQTQTVRIDMVTSEGEQGVMANLQRKAEAADVMFSKLVELMNAELRIERSNIYQTSEEIPVWALPIRSSQTVSRRTMETVSK